MNYKRGNWLMIIWFIAVIWGMINIFGASYARNIANGLWPIRSIMIMSIIFIVLLVILYWGLGLKGKSLKLVNFFNDKMFMFSLIALVLVFIPGLGGIRGGARSVIDLIIVDFQPLELYKVTVLLYLAKTFSKPIDDWEKLFNLFCNSCKKQYILKYHILSFDKSHIK